MGNSVSSIRGVEKHVVFARQSYRDGRRKEFQDERSHLTRLYSGQFTGSYFRINY